MRAEHGARADAYAVSGYPDTGAHAGDYNAANVNRNTNNSVTTSGRNINGNAVDAGRHHLGDCRRGGTGGHTGVQQVRVAALDRCRRGYTILKDNFLSTPSNSPIRAERKKRHRR